jgi:hypothetical protein
MILIVDFNSKSDKVRLNETLKGLKPIPYRVEIKVDMDKRSNRQNRYFHGVMLPILSEHTGYTPNEIKALLKGMFLTYTIELKGLEFELIKNTSDLDTKEMEEFLEKCRMFSAIELDCQIPLPNELLEA